MRQLLKSADSGKSATEAAGSENARSWLDKIVKRVRGFSSSRRKIDCHPTPTTRYCFRFNLCVNRYPVSLFSLAVIRLLSENSKTPKNSIKLADHQVAANVVTDTVVP
jgi:hypothetical protein